MFDFDDTSRRILAQHWKDGTPKEQEEFIRLLTELLEGAYLTSIGNYPLGRPAGGPGSPSSPWLSAGYRVILIALSGDGVLATGTSSRGA